MNVQLFCFESHTKIMSPFLAYAGIALAIVENPYEYNTAWPVPRKFANLSSKCTWTSEKWKWYRFIDDAFDRFHRSVKM